MRIADAGFEKACTFVMVRQYGTLQVGSHKGTSRSALSELKRIHNVLMSGPCFPRGQTSFAGCLNPKGNPKPTREINRQRRERNKGASNCGASRSQVDRMCLAIRLPGAALEYTNHQLRDPILRTGTDTLGAASKPKYVSFLMCSRLAGRINHARTRLQHENQNQSLPSVQLQLWATWSAFALSCSITCLQAARL